MCVCVCVGTFIIIIIIAFSIAGNHYYSYCYYYWRMMTRQVVHTMTMLLLPSSSSSWVEQLHLQSTHSQLSKNNRIKIWCPIAPKSIFSVAGRPKAWRIFSNGCLLHRPKKKKSPSMNSSDTFFVSFFLYQYISQCVYKVIWQHRCVVSLSNSPLNW